MITIIQAPKRSNDKNLCTFSVKYFAATGVCHLFTGDTENNMSCLWLYKLSLLNSASAGPRSDPAHTSGAICWLITNCQHKRFNNNKKSLSVNDQSHLTRIWLYSIIFPIKTWSSIQIKMYLHAHCPESLNKRLVKPPGSVQGQPAVTAPLRTVCLLVFCITGEMLIKSASIPHCFIKWDCQAL